LQIFSFKKNRRSFFSKKIRFFSILILVFLISSPAFSLDMPEMPDFPELTPPSLDNGFYTPKIPYYPKKKNAKNEDQKKDQTENEQTLSSSRTTTDLLNDYLNNTSILSASDINSLSDSGSFSNLSSLYNSSLLSNGQDLSTNTMLQQILKTLEELKEEKKNSEPQDSGKMPAVSEQEPSVLRFKINGYDLKDSLTTVYFSQLENDGSFLFTADRRYIADQKVRNETFYLLFKTKETSGTMITYEVCPSFVQDYKNENSFIYKLCNTKKITATKTGNLVVLRSDSKECTADLLLDLSN